MKKYFESLRATLKKPSPTLALLVGAPLLVLTEVLLSHLTGLPPDSHWAMLHAVLTLEPLGMAIASLWLALWALTLQCALISAHALGWATRC